MKERRPGLGSDGATAGPGIVLGQPQGPFPARLDGDFLRRYAAALGDPPPTSATPLPAAALVTQLWEAQTAGRVAAIPDILDRSPAGGVHGEHDIVLHRPVEAGEPLRLWVEGHGARPSGGRSVVTLRHSARDAQDRLVAEQWWTTVYLGLACDPVGAPPPPHGFPPDARRRPVAEVRVDIDAAMPRRYAEVAGDWSPHHFEVDAARRSGVDRPFLHGLCTMALCGGAVTGVVAGGDPTRVRRLAVRFRAPVFPGPPLEVRVYDAGAEGYAFEATSGDTVAVTHGRVELR
jgi:acyl dehydratase